jgi:CRP/FNR family transcriptional regulator
MQHFNCQNCTVRSESIFANVDSENLNPINEFKVCKFYEKGDYLFHEGDDPKGIFCLRAGKIKVSKIGADGKEQITHLVHPGQNLGHRALFAEEKFSGSAIALEKVHVCFIPRNAMEEIAKKNPEIVWSVAKLLAKELGEAENNMTHLAQDSVRTRLINALKSLIDTYGYTRDGMTINAQIKRQDIADIAGASRETITRQLYNLQSDNLLLLSGKKITILDKSIFNVT